MQIIVTHVSKQHVNQLLIALHRQQWLYRYYTAFAANRWLPLFRHSSSITNQLKKRLYTEIPLDRIKSFVPAFVLEQVGRSVYWTIRNSSRLFDYWVANALKNEGYDLLIGYENANLHTFKAAKERGKITVLDLAQVHHNTIARINSRYRLDTLTAEQTRYIDQRKEQAFTYTDYVLTLSGFATDSLVEAGFAPDRIYQVALGIETNLFTPIQKTVSGTLNLLFVGAIIERKGIRVLLDAFARLTDYNIHLTLVGPPGDAQAALTNPIAGLTYLPYLHHEQLVTCYQQAHVFILPSLLDSWAQVVLEAMACGTPAIITEHTGAKDAVVQGGGFVIPADNPDALVEKIMYFYNERSEITRIGAVARTIAEHYTWDHYHQQVSTALRAIAVRENLPMSQP